MNPLWPLRVISFYILKPLNENPSTAMAKNLQVRGECTEEATVTAEHNIIDSNDVQVLIILLNMYTYQLSNPLTKMVSNLPRTHKVQILDSFFLRILKK